MQEEILKYIVNYFFYIFLGPARNVGEVKERQLVSALARNDLEDKYLRLREDHMVSKLALFLAIALLCCM